MLYVDVSSYSYLTDTVKRAKSKVVHLHMFAAAVPRSLSDTA